MIARARRVAAVLATVSVVAGLTWVGAPSAHADAVRAKQWYLSALGIQQAWAMTKGASVKIGIVDSGVDGTAPDLKGAVVAGRDFSGVGSANGEKPVNGDPHGTEVAAMAAARGHGGDAGVIGAAPAASIVTASVDDNSTDTTAFGDAVHWLVDQGVSVINLSIFTTSTVSVDSLHAAVRYAQSKNVVVVAATGDLFKGATGLEAPAFFPGVVAVTGVDKNLKRDPSATIGEGTAIAAPFSTTPVHPFSNASYVGLPTVNPRGASGGAYGNGAGTSLSAPIVAGIIALIRAKYPHLDAANVVNRLLKTATPAGGKVPNNTYGYGIVNAEKALTANVPTVSANPLGGAAPSTSTSTAPRSSSASAGPATHSSVPAASSAPAAAVSSTSSGLGTGAWIGIIAAALVVAALVAWIVARSRRAGAGPPGPSQPPPRHGQAR